MKHQFLILFALSIVLITCIGNSYASVISPKKQASLDFPPNVVCKADLVKLIKISSNDVACVFPSSTNKLPAYDWTGVISTELQNELIQEKQRLMPLTRDSDRVKNFNKLFNVHVTKIIEMRNQITNEKAESKDSIFGIQLI